MYMQETDTENDALSYLRFLRPTKYGINRTYNRIQNPNGAYLMREYFNKTYNRH